VRIGVDPDGLASSTATFESISQDVAGANGAVARTLSGAAAAAGEASLAAAIGAATPAGGGYRASSIAVANACTDASMPARTCAATLSGIAEDVRATAMRRFLDLMGGPATVPGVLGLESQFGSGAKLGGLLQDMNKGDWDVLAKLNPNAYTDVVDTAAQYGPDSMQAPAAQLHYEETVADEAFGEFEVAAVPAAAIPAGKLAGTVAVGADMGVGSVASGAFHDGEKLLSWLNPL
jgi:hypothetical protein